MVSGGPRAATPGQQYPNRSDMRTTQPIRVAEGQPYGEAKAQTDALKVIPLQNDNPAAQAAAPQQAPQAPLPGQLTAPGAPTMRPAEHIMTMNQLPAAPPVNLAGTIAQIAQQTGNADLMVLANHARQQV